MSSIINNNNNLICNQTTNSYSKMSFEAAKQIATDTAIKTVSLVIFSTVMSVEFTVMPAIAIGVGSACAKYAISKLLGDNLLTEALAGYLSYETVKCASLAFDIFTTVFAPVSRGWTACGYGDHDWVFSEIALPGLEAYEVVIPLLCAAILKKVASAAINKLTSETPKTNPQFQ